jgi:hypothetical protein
MKRPARDKHSILLGSLVNYGRKKFYRIVLKTFVRSFVFQFVPRTAEKAMGALLGFLSPARKHAHPHHSLSLSLSLSLPLSPSLSLSLSLKHTHTHTHTRKVFSPSLSHINTHAHSVSDSLSLNVGSSLTHIQRNQLSLSHSPSLLTLIHRQHLSLTLSLPSVISLRSFSPLSRLSISTNLLHSHT